MEEALVTKLEICFGLVGLIGEKIDAVAEKEEAEGDEEGKGSRNLKVVEVGEESERNFASVRLCRDVMVAIFFVFTSTSPEFVCTTIKKTRDDFAWTWQLLVRQGFLTRPKYDRPFPFSVAWQNFKSNGVQQA